MDDVSVIRPALREISLLENNKNVTDDIKCEVAKDEDTVRVKVHRPGMEPILFLLKMSTPMRMLMRKFCREANIGFEGLRFVVDGKRIQGFDTPKSLELEHDDLIDVYQYQFGGCGVVKFESNRLRSWKKKEK